jgi:phospholipid/cholesterol/gamma-HCH transport system substrate-binding protein
MTGGLKASGIHSAEAAGTVSPSTLVLQVRARRLRRAVLLRVLAGLAASCTICAGAVVAIRASYGNYSGRFTVKALVPANGEGIVPGSPVLYRGVQVGQVQGAAIVRGQPVLYLTIYPGERIPASVSARIAPENSFGADEVDLVESDRAQRGWLHQGSTIPTGELLPDISDLIAKLDVYLNKVDVSSLAATIDEAARSFNGESVQIAESLKQGAELAGFLDATLEDQLRALDSFQAAAAALADAGPRIDALAASANPFLAFFEGQARQFAEVLSSLGPFARKLASFISLYQPDLADLIDKGANVTALLADHSQDLVSLLKGVVSFLLALKSGIQGPLSDGTYYGNFATFVMAADLNALVCGLLSPATTGLAYLAPLQAALSSAGTALSCPQSEGPAPGPQVSVPAPAPGALAQLSPAQGVPGAAQALVNEAESTLATPVPVVSQGLAGIFHNLLGGTG